MRKLSPRQNEIIKLLVLAKSTKEIAQQTNLTPNTVKRYLEILYRKIKVKNRTGAARWALENNITGIKDPYSVQGD